MKIWPNIEQRSEEWFRIRAGRATASQFSKIVTPTGAPSKQWEGYAIELMAESVVPDEERWPGNWQTDRGAALEPEAVAAFEETLPANLMVEECGFITHDNGVVGCSPDGLIRDDKGEIVAGVEVKCPLGKRHVETIIGGELPKEHAAQVHGSLAVTGLPLWYFVSYHPAFAMFVTEVRPDAFTAKISAALDKFVMNYGAMREKHMPKILKPNA